MKQKYPGVKIGARGKNIPAGSYYGYATGIVGLRLFPNPDFDERAARRNGTRFATTMIRATTTSRISSSHIASVCRCGFCHVGPNPVKPPADPDHPKWENLSSNVGAQYFWIDRIFDWDGRPARILSSSSSTRRGPARSIRRLFSTDNINNPRTMNAVYMLGPRVMEAKRWGKETLAGGGQNNKQFNDYVTSGPLTEFFETPDTVWTPRVLKDGVRFCGRVGRTESCLSQHRNIQRRVAAALQRASWRQADHANRNQCRAQEFGVFHGHRSANVCHGRVLSENHRRHIICRTRTTKPATNI